MEEDVDVDGKGEQLGTEAGRGGMVPEARYLVLGDAIQGRKPQGSGDVKQTSEGQGAEMDDKEQQAA